MTTGEITRNGDCEFSFSRTDVIEAVRNFENEKKILLEKSVLCKSLIDSAEKYLLDENGNLHKEIVEFEKNETPDNLKKYAELNGFLMSLLQQHKDEFLTEKAARDIQKEFEEKASKLPQSLRKFLDETMMVINSQLDQLLSRLNDNFRGYELIYVLSIRGNYFCSKDYETVEATNVVDIIRKKTWLKNVINISGVISLINLSLFRYSSTLKIFPTSRSIGTVSRQFKLPFISLNPQTGQGAKNHAKIIFDCLVELIRSNLGSKAEQKILNILTNFLDIFPGAKIVIGFGVQFIECVSKSEGVVVFENAKRYLQRVWKKLKKTP